MAIVVSEPTQKDWERPEDGQYIGVIVDVIDLGEVQTGFGVKPKVQIKWMLDTLNSEGEPYFVSAFYTASLHEKANLRKALKSILGADVSGQFDLEELLGINNQLVVETTESGEKTYTNIVAILKVPKGTQRLAIPDDFVRYSEKQKQKQGKTQGGTQKKAAAQLKKTAPKVTAPAPVAEPEVEEIQPVEEQAQVAAPVAAPKAAAPANRAGTIRQARTVTPAPAAAPAAAPTVDLKAAKLAALRAQLAAAEAEEAPATAPISDEDIPF
jgi:hypothetical protein